MRDEKVVFNLVPAGLELVIGRGGAETPVAVRECGSRAQHAAYGDADRRHLAGPIPRTYRCFAYLLPDCDCHHCSPVVKK
jgi:hypothetical protein